MTSQMEEGGGGVGNGISGGRSIAENDMDVDEHRSVVNPCDDDYTSSSDDDNMSESDDTMNDDYTERGVKREFGDCRDYDSSSSDEDNYVSAVDTFGASKSPNGQKWEKLSILHLTEDVVFKEKAKFIPDINNKKFITGSFSMGVEGDAIGSLIVSALVLCDVYCWSTEENHIYFAFIKRAKKLIEAEIPKEEDENLDSHTYLTKLSDSLGFSIAVISENEGFLSSEAPFNVEYHGNERLKYYVYIVRRCVLKANGDSSYYYRSLVSQGYKNGNNRFNEVVYLEKPKSLRDFIISKGDYTHGTGEFTTHRQAIVNAVMKIQDEEDPRNVDTATYINAFIDNYKDDVSFHRALVSDFEILVYEHEESKTSVLKARNHKKRRKTKTKKKRPEKINNNNNNINNNNNNNNNNNQSFSTDYTNGDNNDSALEESGGEDFSIKSRRMGYKNILNYPDHISLFAKASKWQAEVVSAAFDCLNLIIFKIGTSSDDVNDPTHISNLFKGFDPKKDDKPGCLITHSFLKALVSAVSSNTISKAQADKFPIIAQVVQDIYFDVEGEPNACKVARARLAQTESCGLLRGKLLECATKEMLVAVNNWFSVGQIQHQTAFFKQNYNLIGRAVAKTFQRRVGTSKQGRINEVSLNYAKRLATQIRHLGHEIERFENEGGNDEKVEKLKKERLVQIKYRRQFEAGKLTMGSPEFEKAEKEFLRVNKLPGEVVERRGWDESIQKKPKLNKPPSEDSVLALTLQFIDESRKNIPDHDGQLAAIKYRLQMQKALDGNVRERNTNVKLPTYAPTKSIAPAFITIEKEQLRKLLPIKVGRKILRSVKEQELSTSPKELDFYFNDKGEVVNQIPLKSMPTTETTSTTNNEEMQVSPDGDTGLTQANDKAVSPSNSTEWTSIIKNIDLRDAMPYLFQEEAMKRFVSDTKDGKKRAFGSSFQVNTIQLTLKIISEDKVIGDKKRQSNAKAVKATKKAEREEKSREENENEPNSTTSDGTVADVEVQPVTKPDTKTLMKMNNEINNPEAISIAKKERKVQKIEGTFWGLDFGLHMLFGAAHSTNAYPPMTISRKEFNNNVGVSTKNFRQEKSLEKKMATDEDFKRAMRQRTENTFKTTDLNKVLEAVITRIGTFNQMYDFYGDDKYARDRFMNRNNQEREFARIADLLFVGNVTNLVCGDATMPNGLKGSQTSLESQFFKYIERVKGKGTIIFCSEHRSSILDSNTRKAMYNPMMKLSKKKIEKREQWKQRERENQSTVTEVPSDVMEIAGVKPKTWEGGEDRSTRLTKMGSKGGGIFRQERKVKERGGGEEGREESGIKKSRVWGLYQVSMPGYSYLWNRDINAAINIVSIYLHLLEFEEEPWEFRKNVHLMKNPVYIPTKTKLNSRKLGSLAADL